ncbi:hypothetical protein NE237_021904 [Protea cynaroides]|uniref:Uncharacterized protein n=1 Tax=Protea cynaroides TaxID=273540 RepID=A0A9Q0HA09_9MAGN|nr:hypothetical protein NE237_021904 [Protea cynaroides]
MALTKVIIVVFVIVVGFFKIAVSNWPPFVTNGFKAVMTGEMTVFFAYVGLDAMAISIEECRNPHRNPLKDAWALFLDQDALNIFTREWILNPKAPYYMNLSGWTTHKHQTCMKCGYTGTPCDLKSYFEGIKEYIEKPSYAPGSLDIQCAVHNGHTKAIQIATEAEVVMVVAGLDLSQEIGGQVLAMLLFGEFNPRGRLPMTWYPEYALYEQLTDSLQLYFLVRDLGLLAMALLNDIVTNDSEDHLSGEAKKLLKSLESL